MISAQPDLHHRVVEHAVTLYEKGWHVKACTFCEAALALGLGSPVLLLVYSLTQSALNNNDAAREAVANFDATIESLPESVVPALRGAREKVVPYLPGNTRSVGVRQKLRSEAVRFIPRLAAGETP